MKKILTPIIIVLVLVLLIAYFVTSNKKVEQVTITHEILVQQIEELGNLEVVKYNIQDMMEYEKARRWLPNSKTSLKVVGEVIACVDLTKIRAEDIVTKGDSVSLTLPIPEICHYKIDHSRSRVYNIEYGLWESAQLVDDAYHQAEENLYQQALQMGIATESRENTIKVLTPILRGLGFKKIYIGFKSPDQSVTSERTPKIEPNKKLN